MISSTQKSKQLALLDRPAGQLLNDFGAGKASPGSGSAAALMGLLSVKLLITVCDKSATKDDCRKHEALLKHVRAQMDIVEPALIDLFEKDAKEFDQVVDLRVQRDNAETPAEKAAFSKKSQELLETATENAFHIIEQCMKLIDHGIAVFESGWHAVRGDSGAAISAAIAGVMSGIFIVNLNLKTLKKRKYAADNVERCEKLYRELQAKQNKAFSCVTSLSSEAITSIQLELRGEQVATGV